MWNDLKKSRVVRIFSWSIFADFFQKALNLLNSILMMRFLGPDVTGHYLMMMAGLGAVPAILNSFDQAITRFLGGVSDDKKLNLSVGVMVSKIYGCALIVVLILALSSTNLVPEYISSIYINYNISAVYCSIVSFWIAPIVNGWSSRILSTHRDYNFQIATDIAQNFLVSAWIFIALLIINVTKLDVILYGFAIIFTGSMAIKSVRTTRWIPNISKGLITAIVLPREAFGELFAKHHRQYFLPFFLGSISGFLKELFPLVVVGAVAAPKAVAEFRVVQQLFRVAHSIVPNAFELIRPSLIGAQSPSFFQRYQRYSIAYLIAAAAFGFVVIIALGPILSMWSLTLTPELQVVAVLLALELLFGTANQIELQIFLLREKTTYLLFMSLVRQAIAAAFMTAAGNYIGQTGVAAGTTLGALYGWLGFAVYAHKTNLRPVTDLRLVHWLTVAFALGLVIPSMSF